MVVEKLIPRRGTYEFPYITFLGMKHRYESSSRVLNVQYEYWYDGRLFLLGFFDKKKDLYLMEVETGSMAVCYRDFPGKPSVDEVIQKFKERVKESGGSIHEVVRNFRNRNFNLELWFVKSLII